MSWGLVEPTQKLPPLLFTVDIKQQARDLVRQIQKMFLPKRTQIVGTLLSEMYSSEVLANEFLMVRSKKNSLCPQEIGCPICLGPCNGCNLG